MTEIRLQNINQYFGETHILKNIDFTFLEGKFYTILGPSGCGKTTLLKIIGGFVNQTSGDLYFGDKKMNEIPANKRQVNTVFQDYALFPHLNVYENVAFGLKIKKVSKVEREARIKEALRFTNLTDFKYRDIEQLSGGQKQRVAIARAIVNEPDILLLDESLSALDHNLRVDMQYELKELQQKLGITFIFVTHDQEEALALSDEILVMDKGHIVQAGSPKDIYDEPLNKYVADFIGESNIVEGEMLEDGKVSIYGRAYECVDGGVKSGTPVEIMVRPEDIVLKPLEEGHLNVTVDSILFRGVHYEICVLDEDGYEWVIHTTQKTEEGKKVSIYFDKEDMHIMVPGEKEDEFNERLELYEGIL
ncbi:ABC transporter ATP-binding protein [Phocicoccus pinnipedialis]|uniref:Spermidine/putrescine import ATP-binding protein PotA n=1 Tax=Phocicoccus pinnipedialis TaxID=110845 RepID=A0A6V7RJ71_9BACL|nr:ABC transporter ATP-binding protein [Jeotgalicoccus pinnipedialis]MBP1938997.1 spermidine/putrescine transport system ATP-binding protein [Jeotgalicoccus pinnipedialis]CAD2077246.1 Spermidine/putrescine import ATP-binding protein PotA [Jeotgalicoccus pinnipedialis]